MAVLKTFCFYFSCRLGSLLIGVINLIQATIWIGFCIYYLKYSDILSENINELLTDEDMDYSDVSGILNSIKDDPQSFLNKIIAYFILFALTCIGMMYGVYKLRTYIVFPFIFFYFAYITSLLVVYIIALLILKKNDHGLGPLILFSILGEFIFLYKYYTWFCVVSYCQIIYELKKQILDLKIHKQKDKFSVFSKNY